MALVIGGFSVAVVVVHQIQREVKKERDNKWTKNMDPNNKTKVASTCRRSAGISGDRLSIDASG